MNVQPCQAVIGSCHRRRVRPRAGPREAGRGRSCPRTIGLPTPGQALGHGGCKARGLPPWHARRSPPRLGGPRPGARSGDPLRAVRIGTSAATSGGPTTNSIILFGSVSRSAGSLRAGGTRQRWPPPHVRSRIRRPLRSEVPRNLPPVDGRVGVRVVRHDSYTPSVSGIVTVS